jgi:ribonuclease III
MSGTFPPISTELPAGGVTDAARAMAAMVEQATGLHFLNPMLALRALTHSSFANERLGAEEDYERLEFLGDAVLDFLVAYWLFQKYPTLPEGELTRIRSALVRTESLAALSRQYGLGSLLRIGKGERQTGGAKRITLLCACLEALMGALVLDQGVEAVFNFLSPYFESQGAALLSKESSTDYKSLFQEWAQSRTGITPVYRMVRAEGPDHDRWYTVEVLVGDIVYGCGSGNSKQNAAQEAAREAMTRILDLPQTSNDSPKNQ